MSDHRVDYGSVEVAYLSISGIFIGWPLALGLLEVVQKTGAGWLGWLVAILILWPWLVWVFVFLYNSFVAPLVNLFAERQRLRDEGIRRQLEIERRAEEHYDFLRRVGRNPS